MSPKILLRWSFIAVGLLFVGQLVWPTAGEAQTLTGQASAVQATVLGMTTSLADTGTLSDSNDARDASLLTGSVPSLLAGEAMHATTIGYPDEVDSEASLGNLAMSVAGNGISADFVMARVFTVLNAAPIGTSSIGGLTINGIPIIPTGDPNQTLSFGILSVVLNEQIPTADGIIVNALHVRTIDGLTDVVIGSAKAGVSSSGGILPLLGAVSAKNKSKA